MSSFIAKLKHFDMPLLFASGLLIVAGLAILYATSLSGGTLQIFYRQLVFIAIAVAGFFGFSFYNYHNLAKVNRWVYIVLILSLLYLLFFGRAIRGSARWIDIGFFNLQPAEFAKLVVILGLGRWLYLKRGQINSWKSIAITFIYAALPAVLIFLEPDLGSSIVVMSVWIGMLLVSPMKKIYVAAFLAIGLVVAGLGWQFVLKDYQKTRVHVFLNPELDARGRGYNVRQAIIAVGSGGIMGRGLGQGLQSQLKFLPERQTDFIFASAAEEIGFVGCTALLILYYIVGRRLVKIMMNAKDDLGYYITAGVLVLMFTQIIINISMNVGMLPVTGIPLPFLSYGGSSLVVVLLGLGVVQNVAKQSRILRF